MRKYNIYNQEIINRLMRRHNLGKNYILKSIRGERARFKSIKIKEEYEKLDNASKLAVKNLLSKEL